MSHVDDMQRGSLQPLDEFLLAGGDFDCEANALEMIQVFTVTDFLEVVRQLQILIEELLVRNRKRLAGMKLNPISDLRCRVSMVGFRAVKRLPPFSPRLAPAPPAFCTVSSLIWTSMRTGTPAILEVL
jgi:hypothetical protein